MVDTQWTPPRWSLAWQKVLAACDNSALTKSQSCGWLAGVKTLESIDIKVHFFKKYTHVFGILGKEREPRVGKLG